MSAPNGSVVLRVENLVKQFPVRLGAYGERKAVVHAVDGVTFHIRKGETLGLVGESGCGKSTTGRTILQLYRPTSGKVYYHDEDLIQLGERQLRPLRQKMQIIFQDPYTALSPRMTIGRALAEPIMVHNLLPKEEIQPRVAALLRDVGMNPDYRNRYQHEFSGGQRQRLCIARALACDPEFIVCDEPVSALDVSVQAQIINLLQDLQREHSLTYLFIAHDLGVVKHISDHVAVMYLGQLVELAAKDVLFGNPLHPYTRALLSAVPVPNPKLERARRRVVLEGDVPSAIDPPSGCRFHPRCPSARPGCSQAVPEWLEVDPGHWVACHSAS